MTEQALEDLQAAAAELHRLDKHAMAGGLARAHAAFTLMATTLETVHKLPAEWKELRSAALRSRDEARAQQNLMLACNHEQQAFTMGVLIEHLEEKLA